MRILSNYRQVINLKELNDLMLKKIFDKKGMSIDETRLLERNLVIWTKARNKTKMETQILRNILTALLDDENKKFDKTKETFKLHKIDYKGFYQRVQDAG